MSSVRAYIFGLAFLAAAALSAWFYCFEAPFNWEILGGAVVLALMCAVAQRFPISFTQGTVEVIDAVILTSLVLLGPLWTLVVVLPTFMYRDHLRVVYVASSDTLMILSIGFVLQSFTQPLMVSSRFDSSLVYGITIAGAMFYSMDAGINSVLMRLKYAIPVAENLRNIFLPVLPTSIAATLTTIGAAFLTISFGPAVSLILLLGTVAALISLHLIHTRQKENEALKEENVNLLASVVEFAAGLVEAVGEKDGYTSRLAAASSVYAGDVGREFGFERSKVDRLKVAALLQDVGFSGVPDEVLLAPPEKLNPAGIRQLERHPVVGEKILSGAAAFEEAAKWVRWHHERPDGSGYPDGLKGQWIPLEARILAAAQTYASLVLDGPGSPTRPAHEARIALTSLSGKGLDGEVVKTLLRVLDREDAAYATAAGERFVFSNPVRESFGGVSLRVVGDEAVEDGTG